MLFSISLEFQHPFSFYRAAGHLAGFQSSLACGRLVRTGLLTLLVIVCIYIMLQQQVLNNPECGSQILFP